MAGYIRTSYCKIDNALSYFTKKAQQQSNGFLPLEPLFDFMRTCPEGNNGAWRDTELGAKIDELLTDFNDHEITITLPEDTLVKQYLSILEKFNEYLSFYGDMKERTEEVSASLYKLCAVVIGANLGDYVAFHELKRGNELFTKLDGIFGQGI
jgi:hypothetical protein